MISPDLINATAIIERITREAEDMAAANLLFASRKQDAAREEAEALADRARLVEAAKRGTLVTETHEFGENGLLPKIKSEHDVKRLEAANARVEAARRKKAALEGPAQMPRLSVPRIELELGKYARAKLIEVERPALPLKKHERPLDALPRLRQTALDLIEERKAAEKAPRTLAEVTKAAHSEIDRLADRGLPKTLRMFHGAGLEWPRHQLPAVSGNPSLHSVPDAFALVAFLLRDKLKAEVNGLLSINAGAFTDALSADEKEERLANLDLAIEEAERNESACVETIIAEGGTAHHRPGCNILAVLSLRLAD